VNTTTEEMIRRLDGMGEEERPGILDHMTKCPFIITDICHVKLILVFLSLTASSVARGFQLKIE
jgi:hypothetical protein